MPACTRKWFPFMLAPTKQVASYMQASIEAMTPYMLALIHKAMAPYSVGFDSGSNSFFPAYFKSQGMNFPHALSIFILVLNG